MLSKIPFYHQTTRKAVVAFGGLFSKLFITTKDNAGVTARITQVPVAYAPKEKFIVRLQQDPTLNEDLNVKLPRLSFEIGSMSYDPARKLNKIHSIKGVGGSTYQYTPVPYDLRFELNSYARNSEENLQIMEQILPYFTPELTISLKMQADPEIVQDIPLILENIQTNDNYDGSFEDFRMIITTYSFRMKLNYYGPLVGAIDPEGHFESDDAGGILKTVTINLNTRKYTVSVDPLSAMQNDPHTLVDSWGDRTGLPATDFGIGNTL